MPHVAPTPIAMRVTGLEQTKFNEASSRGYYHPRATAVPGTPRKFDHTELLGCWVMARLLSIGIQLPMAAGRANSVRDVADLAPDTTRIVTWAVWQGGEAVYSDAAPPSEKPPPDAMRITFNIPVIRATIAERLTEITVAETADA